MNKKACEDSGRSGVMWGTVLGFAGRALGKALSVYWVAVIRAEIWSRVVLNMKQDCLSLGSENACCGQILNTFVDK